jgi:hypothetical protein
MTRLILFTVSGMLLLSSGAQTAEPVKKTNAGTCFEPDHPNYQKVRNYIATYKTLEDCINSGGKTPIKTS